MSKKMDEELKQELFRRFEEALKNVVKDKPDPDSTEIHMRMGKWLFATIPGFIEDVFEVGKEVGELSGRLKGYEQGVNDTVKRYKQKEKELVKLN